MPCFQVKSIPHALEAISEQLRSLQQNSTYLISDQCCKIQIQMCHLATPLSHHKRIKKKPFPQVNVSVVTKGNLKNAELETIKLFILKKGFSLGYQRVSSLRQLQSILLNSNPEFFIEKHFFIENIKTQILFSLQRLDLQRLNITLLGCIKNKDLLSIQKTLQKAGYLLGNVYKNKEPLRIFQHLETPLQLFDHIKKDEICPNKSRAYSFFFQHTKLIICNLKQKAFDRELVVEIEGAIQVLDLLILYKKNLPLPFNLTFKIKKESFKLLKKEEGLCISWNLEKKQKLCDILRHSLTLCYEQEFIFGTDKKTVLNIKKREQNPSQVEMEIKGFLDCDIMEEILSIFDAQQLHLYSFQAPAIADKPSFFQHQEDFWNISIKDLTLEGEEHQAVEMAKIFMGIKHNSFAHYGLIIWMQNAPNYLKNFISEESWSDIWLRLKERLPDLLSLQLEPKQRSEVLHLANTVPAFKQAFFEAFKDLYEIKLSKVFEICSQYTSLSPLSSHFISATYPHFLYDHEQDRESLAHLCFEGSSRVCNFEKTLFSPQDYVEQLYGKHFSKNSFPKYFKESEIKELTFQLLTLDILCQAAYSKDCQGTKKLEINDHIFVEENGKQYPCMEKSRVFTQERRYLRYYQEDFFNDVFLFHDIFSIRKELYLTLNPDSQEKLPEDRIQDSQEQINIRKEREMLLIPENAYLDFYQAILKHAISPEFQELYQKIYPLSQSMLQRYGNYFKSYKVENSFSGTSKVNILHFKTGRPCLKQYILKEARKVFESWIQEFPAYLRPDDIRENPENLSYLQADISFFNDLPLVKKTSSCMIHKCLLACTLMCLIDRAEIIEKKEHLHLYFTSFIHIDSQKCKDLDNKENCTLHALSHLENLVGSLHFFSVKKLLASMKTEEKACLYDLLIFPMKRDIFMLEQKTPCELHCFPPDKRKKIVKAKNEILSCTSNLILDNTFPFSIFFRGLRNAPEAVCSRQEVITFYSRRMQTQTPQDFLQNHELCLPPIMSHFPDFLRGALETFLLENNERLFHQLHKQAIVKKRKKTSNFDQAIKAMGWEKINHHDTQGAHCFFISILQALIGIPNNARSWYQPLGKHTQDLIKDLRKALASYIVSNAENYLSYVEEVKSKEECRQDTWAYIKPSCKMSKEDIKRKKLAMIQKKASLLRSNSWVLDVDIFTLSQLVQRKICIYKEIPQERYRVPMQADFCYGEEFPGASINLALINNNHFNWLAPRDFSEKVKRNGYEGFFNP